MQKPDGLILNSRSLIAFFILAFAFSWSIGIPLALAHHGLIHHVLPQWMHYLVAYGPMLSALVVTATSLGLPGLKDFGRRMVRWACPKWLIVAFSPLIIGWVILNIQNAVTGTKLSLVDLGNVNYLPPLGWWALLLWFLTFGLGEEAGWRGFALPRLQKKHDDLSATYILAALWALWHLPMFFYSYEISFTAIGWLIGLFAGSVVLTWLYNSTNQSIFSAAIWHACFNFMTASTVDSGVLAAAVSMVVILIAVLVIRHTETENLVSI